MDNLNFFYQKIKVLIKEISLYSPKFPLYGIHMLAIPVMSALKNIYTHTEHACMHVCMHVCMCTMCTMCDSAWCVLHQVISWTMCKIAYTYIHQVHIAYIMYVHIIYDVFIYMRIYRSTW